MSNIPKPVPAIPRQYSLNQGHSPITAASWLMAGWRDFTSVNLTASLLYGLLVYVISILIVGTLYVLKLDYIMFPALAAFMVVGPALAIGLYEKSRRIAAGQTVSFSNMLFR